MSYQQMYEACQAAYNELQTDYNELKRIKQLTLEELKILDTWLDHQSLPYDNYELQRIVKKIGQLVAQK